MPKPWVWYNEIDPQKAAWIRELIRVGVVAPGEVDERDIKLVQPEDLKGFKQCHFFAGVAVWSYALRLAGWPDDRECWTGSCPCPSFSCAGKGTGFDDPRHLWPHWYPLICKCRPRTIFGEQADDAIGYGWLDLVSTDMEAQEYAFAQAVLGAHSAGAPHIRQRLYFCAHAEDGDRWSGERGAEARIGQDGERRRGSASSSTYVSTCAVSNDSERQRFDLGGAPADCAGEAREQRIRDDVRNGDKPSLGSQPERERLEGHFRDVRDWRGPGWLDPHTARSVAEAGATRGFWGDCDWWYARDEKYRPIEPGLFPLAHGASNRVVKLRGYGDAIVPQVAAEFIQAYCEAAEGINA